MATRDWDSQKELCLTARRHILSLLLFGPCSGSKLSGFCLIEAVVVSLLFEPCGRFTWFFECWKMVMTFISCALFLDVLLGGGDDAARLALKNGSSFQINQPNRKIPMYGLLAFFFSWTDESKAFLLWTDFLDSSYCLILNKNVIYL